MSWHPRARAALLGALALTGCSGGPSGARANLVTGSTGSSWYAIGSAIAERANGRVDGHPLTAVPGAGGVSNPARLGRVPGDLGLSFLPFLRAAQRGEPPFREAYPGLRFVATLIENRLHLIAAEGSGITALTDLRERRQPVRLGTGPPGSSEEFMVREGLARLGVSYADIEAWGGRVDLLGSSERVDAWRDRHLDLIAFSISPPAPLVTELMTSRPGRFLSLPEGVRAALDAEWGIRPVTIPAGTYPSQPEDVSTAGMSFVVFASEGVPAGLVDALVRSLGDAKSYLEGVHAGFREWQPQQMARHGGVPVHPEAARYYTERGWLRD